MGVMFKPLMIAMVGTMNGVVIPRDFPVYLIKPEKVAAFKERFDGNRPGLIWMPLENVQDLRDVPTWEMLS